MVKVVFLHELVERAVASVFLGNGEKLEVVPVLEEDVFDVGLTHLAVGSVGVRALGTDQCPESDVCVGTLVLVAVNTEFVESICTQQILQIFLQLRRLRNC